MELNVYLDVQNVYNFQSTGQTYIDVDKDEQGVLITDPTNPNLYQITEYNNNSGTFLPSIGLMIGF